ncbi:MAG: glycosyltransferase [Pleurocapsa sp.]
MSKVAIFLTALDGGGAEKVMLNLAQGFIESGISVDLLLVKAEGSYLSQIPPEVKLIDFQAHRLLSSIFSLISYLKTKQPQALITALDTNVIAAWLRRWGGISTTTIVTVHNNLSLESRHAKSIKRKLTAKFARWFYGWADNIVAVSHGVAQDLLKIGLPKEKIKVIYNPIVTSELMKKLQEQNSLDSSWFAPGEPPVILGVGRLNEQKDFPTLIKAFAQLRQQQSVRLIILGEGEERSNLQALIEELDITQDVALPGFVDNPYIYMANATVLVLSSAWEGFGNVLVEAMAAGTPVVSTDCPSGPAEILANGKYGKLVAVGNKKELAQAIEKTIQQKSNPDILRQRANDFTLKQAIMHYVNLFNVN